MQILNTTGDKFYGTETQLELFSKSNYFRNDKVKTKSLITEEARKEINPLRYLLSEIDGKFIFLI